MRKIGCLWFILIITFTLQGQTPRIDNVQRIISFPTTTIEISGSGFGTAPQVSFGHVNGTVLSSTETLIRVKVPAQARLGQVEVLNTQSKKVAQSAVKFMVNFNGKQPFVNNFSGSSFSNADDIFDMCVCDFDGDGRPDIVGSKNSDGKSNLMLLVNQSIVQANNSSIAFVQNSIPLNVPSYGLACGDLNGDGKPDLVVTRGGSTNNHFLYIYQNKSSVGNVVFESPVILQMKVGDAGKEIQVHDINRDGRSDIIVTNSQTTSLYIFENKLTSTTIISTEFEPHAIEMGSKTLPLDVADFNGDGWADIVAAPDANGTRIYILVNPANGTFSFSAPVQTQIGGSSNITDLASADFNNDGMMDILIVNRGIAFVYMNKSSMFFQSVNGNTGYLSPTAWGGDVGDMNGDGFADFVVANRDNSNPQTNIYINNRASTPSFTPTKIITPKPNRFVRVGDFDGDAKPDLAFTATNFSTNFSIDIIKNKNCHKPIILNDNPLSICNGQNIILEVLPMPAVTFTWSTGDTGPTSPIGFSNAGEITVTGVGEGGPGGCSVASTITVNAGAGTAPAKPTISGPDGVCSGSSLTLTATSVGGTPTYIWRGSNDFQMETNSPSVTITNSATLANAGNYSVRIKVGDCLSDASDSKSITVVEPESFTISSTSGNAGVCTGQSVTLSVNQVSGYAYQWKKGGTNISSQTNSSFTINSAAAADSGMYSVLISHQTISCSRETSPFTLAVFTAPVAEFTTTPNQICVGTQVNFSASASTVDSKATPSYAWDFGNGATGTGATTSHIYTAAQTSITAKLTVGYTGVNGCSNQKSKSFAINSATPPVITTDPQVTEICGNGTESVVLSVSGTFNAFLWSVATTNTGASITVKSPATYSVTTMDANGCSGKAEITITPKAGCEGGTTPTIAIKVPKIFTPNGDQANDFLVIEGVENYPDCMLSVFDGRGMRVFEGKGSALTGEPWNGRGTAGPVPDGTYYYVFGCPDAKPVTGSVLIVR